MVTTLDLRKETVYPRGYGERPELDKREERRFGLSPWVRGTHFLSTELQGKYRFIPVGTGNAFRRLVGRGYGAVYPRGYGERVIARRCIVNFTGLSPWVRGTLNGYAVGVVCSRFIPVGTGNANKTAISLYSQPVYPRGYGERDLCSTQCKWPYGLSPWVRGTHYEYFERMARERFIPVGTGNAFRAF